LLAAMSDVYRALDDLDGAEQMAQEAAALRAHDTDDADGRFESLRQLARIDNLRGRSALALERVRQARALTGALDSADRAELLGIEALAIEGTGKAKDATALWREALALQAAAFGTDDARTLRATMDLAANLGIVGQGVEAEQLLTENLPRMRRGLASDDPVLGESLRDLSRLARRKKEYARAEALADEALVVYRRIYGDDSSQAAAAMTTAAIGAQANGHADKARALMEKALRTQRAVFGAESAQVATAEYNLGLHLQLHADDRQGALAHLRVAAELGSRLLPAGHPSLANYRLALGSSLREAHQRAEATVVLRQALATFEVANAPRGVDKALARGELACNALPWQEDDGMRRQFKDALAALTREVPDDAQAQRVRACTAQRGGTGKT
jgi:serine/threonine-protein kinase